MKDIRWGIAPWNIDFTPPARPLPRRVDFAVIGGGFTGLAASAWLRRLAPEKSVIVLESGSLGSGASGRTGGMVLAESAAGDLPDLGDVLAGFRDIVAKLDIDCELSLPGAWEIGRSGGVKDSPIQWNDSGSLRVVNEVPGGTLDPGKLVSGLARSAERLGASVFENKHVERVDWGEWSKLSVAGEPGDHEEIAAEKVVFATNALSLALSGLTVGTHPKLTLAAQTAPLDEDRLQAIGLSPRRPFYTVDFPYLWGRTRHDNSIVWGAGLVDAPPSHRLEELDIRDAQPSRMFATFEKRVRTLHPALASVEFTHRWGGPIMFRDDWEPVFDWHPQSRAGIVLGAYAGHGVALSSYLGAWTAEVLLGKRDLPSKWGKISK